MTTSTSSTSSFWNVGWTMADGPADRGGGGGRRVCGLPLPLDVLRSSRDRKSPMGSDEGCAGLLRF
ncbi:hypothetical protein HJC23_000177 [Cyclotella cryptica]|uniref:Uncharacterized protein n=1 Tax=Cyclotella cryptica TaxID=29204 RepID=A0ABD3QCZ9_9STRA